MKPRTLLLAGAVGLLALLCASMLVRAQPKAQSSQRCEAAMIKWDGGDKIQIMTPAKSEVIRVFQAGGQRVTDIPEEEYCLTWAANMLAQEGWELVNLNNRRILMQRAVSR
jgi:hypothetical protein